MGTVFEELVRRFSEKNNEEAGVHSITLQLSPSPPMQWITGKQ
jgi:hypothetical protein